MPLRVVDAPLQPPSVEPEDDPDPEEELAPDVDPAPEAEPELAPAPELDVDPELAPELELASVIPELENDDDEDPPLEAPAAPHWQASSPLPSALHTW